MTRPRRTVGLVAAALVAIAIPTAAGAAPSASSVTVGVAGAAPAAATVTGGPITGQGDDTLGHPLNPCTAPACESFAIVLQAPAGFTVGNQIALAVSTAYDTPPNPPGGPGTLDTYLENSTGLIVAADGGSHNPSKVTATDAAPGTYTLIVAGSTGADNSYTASISTSSTVRVVTPPTTSTITFSTPTLMSPIESVGEPTIVHSPAADNTVYSSGPWGTGTQRSLWYASADGGMTSRLVQQCPPQSGQVAGPCPAPTAASGTANPPGGGDTTQIVDSNGKDYFADLYALACDRVATTTDHGATAAQNAYGCQAATPDCTPTTVPPCRPEGSDRQWLVTYDPKLTGATSTAPDKALAPLTYMEYNHCIEVKVGNGCSYWVKTTDGINFTPANTNAGSYGADGYPAVDQVTGDVFETSNGLLNIGVPDATGNLTFIDDPSGNSFGTKLINYAGAVGASDTLFSVAAMDTGRNLHITWTNSARQVYTTVASYKTNWKTFAAPVHLNAAPSNTNVFPWVAAGGPGRSDSVWYGTSDLGDPSANNGQEWLVYMSQAVWPVDVNGAVTLASPTTQMVQVSPHPAHYNSICLTGTGCITSSGDRNLADFFSVVIDHTGAAEVEYDDTSNGLEQAGFTPANGLADHAGAPVVTIARQDGGPGLNAAPVTTRPNEPTSAPTNGMTDPAGDALYPVIGGTNQPALDLTGNQLALSSDSKTLTLTMNVGDLRSGAITNVFNPVTGVPGAAFLQYVTRWVMCPANALAQTNNCTIYYAMAEATPGAAASASTIQYFAGKAQSIDLCSVSACDPHVEYYPESPSNTLPNATGTTESGSTACPQTGPCTITISINAGDIGSPSQTSLLEEVGTYAFAAARPQAAVTTAQAEADQLPLEVDGICCYNFQAGPAVGTPEVPWTPALLIAATGIAVAGGVRRRRRSTSAA